MGAKTLRSRRVGLVLVLASVLVALCVLAVLTPSETAQTAPVLDQLGDVPDFKLIQQDGKPFARADLGDKVWVADFIFTSCPSICPTMTANMAALQDAFPDAANLHMVSFTVDAETDTPEVLREFAGKYDADLSRWHFLTGPQADIYGFMDAINIGAPETPMGHSSRFVLVDRRGVIRGYYLSLEPEDLEQLKADLRSLLASGGA